MLYLSQTTWSRKALPMVLDTAGPKYKRIYHMTWNAWKRWWDELAKENHTYKLTSEERRRYKGQWCLTLNKAGKNGPMKLRSEYRAAVMVKNRLHHESGEPIEEPTHPGKDEYNKDKKFSPKVTSPALELTNIQDGNIRFHLSGTHPNGVGSELTIFFCSLFFVAVGFVYSRWRSTVTDGV